MGKLKVVTNKIKDILDGTTLSNGNHMQVTGRKRSQKWNDWEKYNQKYTYPNGKSEISEPDKNSEEIGNMIIGEKTFFNMDESVTRKTNNIMVFGTPGAGGTRCWLKPNLLQFNTSFVITDPGGKLLADAGQALMNHGYRIKVLNLSEMQYSCMYNPFRYIRDDKGVETLVKCIFKNTSPEVSEGDPLFAKAEESLLMAIFYYIHYEYKDQPGRQNMGEVMEMLRKAKIDENTEDTKSPLDIMFDELEKRNEKHIAVKHYKIFQMSSRKTVTAILVTSGIRMAPFNIKAIQDLTQKDTLHLEELGDRKQALFVITHTRDSTFNFLAAMMCTQLFETLHYIAGTGNKNSWHLRKGNCVTLKSGQFKNNQQKEDQKKFLESQVERYRNAELEKDDPREEKFQKEDENGIIPWPKIRLVDAKTKEVLQEFYSQAECDMFMDCIRHGKIVQGTIRLPNHVRCLLDESANVGEIPEFLPKLCTSRKYGISCSILLQSSDKIRTMHEKDYQILINSCTTQLFLGSTKKEDTAYYSEILDAQTPAGLISPEEVRSMDSQECLIIINGEKLFKDHKYPLEKHKNYEELADFDPRNALEYRRMFTVPDPNEREKEMKDLLS